MNQIVGRRVDQRRNKSKVEKDSERRTGRRVEEISSKKESKKKIGEIRNYLLFGIYINLIEQITLFKSLGQDITIFG